MYEKKYFKYKQKYLKLKGGGVEDEFLMKKKDDALIILTQEKKKEDDALIKLSSIIKKMISSNIITNKQINLFINKSLYLNYDSITDLLYKHNFLYIDSKLINYNLFFEKNILQKLGYNINTTYKKENNINYENIELVKILLKYNVIITINNDNISLFKNKIKCDNKYFYNNYCGACALISSQMMLLFSDHTTDDIFSNFNLNYYESNIKNISNLDLILPFNYKFKLDYINYFLKNNILELLNYHNFIVNNITELTICECKQNNIIKSFKSIYVKLESYEEEAEYEKENEGFFQYEYIFLINLLSIFFMNKKIKLTNYYIFNSNEKYNFDILKDTDIIGLYLISDDHASCIYKCNGTYIYYNNGKSSIFDFESLKNFNNTTQFLASRNMIDLNIVNRSQDVKHPIKYIILLKYYDTTDTDDMFIKDNINSYIYMTMKNNIIFNINYCDYINNSNIMDNFTKYVETDYIKNSDIVNWHTILESDDYNHIYEKIIDIYDYKLFIHYQNIPIESKFLLNSIINVIIDFYNDISYINNIYIYLFNKINCFEIIKYNLINKQKNSARNIMITNFVNFIHINKSNEIIKNEIISNKIINIITNINNDYYDTFYEYYYLLTDDTIKADIKIIDKKKIIDDEIKTILSSIKYDNTLDISIISFINKYNEYISIDINTIIFDILSKLNYDTIIKFDNIFHTLYDIVSKKNSNINLLQISKIKNDIINILTKTTNMIIFTYFYNIIKDIDEQLLTSDIETKKKSMERRMILFDGLFD